MKKLFSIIISIILFFSFAGCDEKAVDDAPIIISPSFTTDTNNFLASTNDTTDRSVEIKATLDSTGVCKLGPGDFYITNLHMPPNAVLCGAGNATKIFLPDNVTDGYAVRLNDNCMVKDLRITSPTPISISETVANRHGIVFLGSYDVDKMSGGRFMSISNVSIDNFTGGGITCYNTGYSSNASIGVSDVIITNCNAGINIAYWSEYHRFTNVVCNSCWYGCINNGGNNVFVNCAFNSNKVGFIIDNRNNDKPNNAHGSAVGCTFNHMDGDEGYGIKIYNVTNGFVFEGCQIFYAKTFIENAEGILFANCNLGRGEGIQINGGGTILYNACMFGNKPNIIITNNKYTKFVDCYVRSGEMITR